MDIVNRDVEAYMRELQARHDEPVLLEMEAYAHKHHFPIVDRLVGATLEVLARTLGARRVVELGSGFGYSGYWFSRAIGPDGELHLTDLDPENREMALDRLGRAALDGPVEFHVGDALEVFRSLPGGWDIVYNDIDKEEYPDAWRAARDRIRVGGLYLCDNVLWYGKVTGETDDGRRAESTRAIVEHNRLIAADEGYLSTIVPTRDGVMVAVRVA